MAVLRGTVCIECVFDFYCRHGNSTFLWSVAFQPDFLADHASRLSSPWDCTVLYCKPMIQNLPTPWSAQLSTLTQFWPYARRECNTVQLGIIWGDEVATSSPPPVGAETFCICCRYDEICLYFSYRRMACWHPRWRIRALSHHQHRYARTRRGSQHDLRQFKHNLIFYGSKPRQANSDRGPKAWGSLSL